MCVAFSPNQPGDDEAAFKAMSNCIRCLRDWMVRDRLKLNEDKTEVVLIGTRQQLAKVNVTSIVVGDETIEAKPSVRNLGSWFDSQLSILSGHPCYSKESCFQSNSYEIMFKFK